MSHTTCLAFLNDPNAGDDELIRAASQRDLVPRPELAELPELGPKLSQGAYFAPVPRTSTPGRQDIGRLNVVCSQGFLIGPCLTRRRKPGRWSRSHFQKHQSDCFTRTQTLPRLPAPFLPEGHQLCSLAYKTNQNRGQTRTSTHERDKLRVKFWAETTDRLQVGTGEWRRLSLKAKIEVTMGAEKLEHKTKAGGLLTTANSAVFYYVDRSNVSKSGWRHL
jgi:hypothetical protein